MPTMGEIYNEGDFNTAKILLYQSLKIEQSPITYNELAIISILEKDYQKALQSLEMGKNIDNSYWPIYINEARCYMKLEDFEDTETILFELKQLSNSEYWVAYADFYLAVLYFNFEGNCEKALNHLNMSKMLEDDDALSSTYLKSKSHINENCD